MKPNGYRVRYFESSHSHNSALNTLNPTNRAQVQADLPTNKISTEFINIEFLNINKKSTRYLFLFGTEKTRLLRHRIYMPSPLAGPTSRKKKQSEQKKILR